MGWGSANEIFDPLAEAIIKKVDAGNVDHEQATDILYTLISKLQDGDWDTEDESLEQYQDHPYVVAAFARASIYQRYDLGDEVSVRALVRDSTLKVQGAELTSLVKAIMRTYVAQ